MNIENGHKVINFEPIKFSKFHEKLQATHTKILATHYSRIKDVDVCYKFLSWSSIFIKGE
jgi:hypothetical protein